MLMEEGEEAERQRGVKIDTGLQVLSGRGHKPQPLYVH